MALTLNVSLLISFEKGVGEFPVIQRLEVCKRIFSLALAEGITSLRSSPLLRVAAID